jgi:ribonucleotide reductase beta subunit family protein with ferritin-like domain
MNQSILNDKTRMCLFPIQSNRQEIWEFYKLQQSVFWSAEETRFIIDREHYKNKLNDKERYFIKNILAYFAVGDGYVIANLMENFTSEFNSTEVIYNYNFQTMIEQVHAEVYAKTIDALIEDSGEKSKCFAVNGEMPAIKRKTEWIKQWMDTSKSIGERLIAFAAVEGVLFSGSFCSIFWLKERGLMPGLAHANALISRDEGLHTDFACMLNRYLAPTERAGTETVHQIIKSAVAMEKQFIIDALPCSLIGMNSCLMGQYIEFVADRLCLQLGHDKIYHSKNPFPFMERMSIDAKVNFFERDVAEYAKAGVGLTDQECEISFTDDF